MKCFRFLKSRRRHNKMSPIKLTYFNLQGKGETIRLILAAAKEYAADLIIMGSHRPELQDYLLGPNAARVVRHSAKSVLVVR